MTKHGAVQEAEVRLSEVLRRAREGEPQHVGLNDGCVVVSEEVWAAVEGRNLGAWLAENAPRGESVELPSRRSRRGDPFASARRSRRP